MSRKDARRLETIFLSNMLTAHNMQVINLPPPPLQDPFKPSKIMLNKNS
jgi:hypothetical protein